MQKVMVIGYTAQISSQIRATREASADLHSEGMADCKYALVVSHNNRIPVWIAEISTISFSPGKGGREATFSLSRVSALEQAWTLVSGIIQGKHLDPGEIVLLNVDALFALGESLTQTEGEPVATLTAEEASTRLAWTYGVNPGQVKISIQL